MLNLAIDIYKKTKFLKKIKKYFQVLVSVVLLYLIISWIDFDQVINALKGMNYWFFLLAFFVFTIDRIIMAFKWNLLLKVKGIGISLFEAAKIYYISNFVGLILPATVGADLVKTHLIVKKKNSMSDVIASILVERLFGFLGLFVYALTAVFLMLGKLNDLQIDFRGVIITLIIFSFLGILGTIMSFNDKTTNFFIKFLKSIENKKFWNRISPKIQKLIFSYQSYKKKKIVLLLFFSLTLVEIFTGIYINFLIATGLNLSVPITYFVAYIPIMMLLVRIPVSFGGLGISEGGTIYFLGLVGVPKALGFSVGIISDFIAIIGLIPGAVFYALNRSETKIKLTELKDTVLVKEP